MQHSRLIPHTWEGRRGICRQTCRRTAPSKLQESGKFAHLRAWCRFGTLQTDLLWPVRSRPSTRILWSWLSSSLAWCLYARCRSYGSPQFPLISTTSRRLQLLRSSSHLVTSSWQRAYFLPGRTQRWGRGNQRSRRRNKAGQHSGDWSCAALLFRWSRTWSTHCTSSSSFASLRRTCPMSSSVLKTLLHRSPVRATRCVWSLELWHWLDFVQSVDASLVLFSHSNWQHPFLRRTAWLSFVWRSSQCFCDYSAVRTPAVFSSTCQDLHSPNNMPPPTA